MMDKFPDGVLACVIDSYDYKKFIIDTALNFKDKILNRDGKIVYRPDSGDPVSTSLEVINLLGENFGYTINNKGFKVLNPKVSMLWGDGIDYNGIRNILFTFKNNGWASNNISFGMGGGLLQKVNRDTQRCAIKSSAQKRNGEWFDISKNPLDPSKKSMSGKLMLVKENDHYITKKYDIESNQNLLQTVFHNGELINRYTFDEIKCNLNNN
jgi:nicotinamide phosphoribosyltransferase